MLFDRSQPIKESIDDVQFTLMLTISLVVLVIFLFLRNLSATIIPSLAVPLSLVATFGIMQLLGYSLNNLSLMALPLAVGFVIDDAVVMLENIVRHLEMGEKPLQAALNGSKEIGFTILSTTISLVAVFIPILFMGGILGRLFKEFAVTMGVAILVSGIVSLTLTPMLCARFLKPPHHQGEHNGDRRKTFKTRLYDASELFFNGMQNAYAWSLNLSLKHHALGFGAGAEARRPLGLAVVGGLVFSQFLTLYLTPVFYTYMESWQEKLSQRQFPRQQHPLEMQPETPSISSLNVK